MNFEISKNKCEICRQKAQSGIIDTEGIIRYSCIDHYLQVYDIIKQEWMMKRMYDRYNNNNTKKVK